MGSAKDRIAKLGKLSHVETINLESVYGDPEDIFYLRALDVRTFEHYQAEVVASLKDKRDHQGLRSMLLAMALCEEDGTPLFKWREEEAQRMCSAIPMKLADPLYKKAQEINVGDEGETEEIAKNSKSATTEDSFSSLQ